METLGLILFIGGGILFTIIPSIVTKLISIPLTGLGYLLIKYSPDKGVAHGK